MTIALLLILLCFAVLDIRYKKIPNIAVIPAIVLGIVLTGYWLPALVMFILTTLIYIRYYWHGGDVKLFTMLGAFIGGYALIVLVSTLVLIYLFRIIRDYKLALPVAPFVFVSTVVITGITSLLQFCKILVP